MNQALQAWVAERTWYHTIDLAPGVETPGWFDLRSFAATLPWGDLTGKRCLDVGTFEGFWAFQMERRGAAEVVAIDVLDPLSWDWPTGSSSDVIKDMATRHRGGEAFPRVKEILDSKVVRHDCNVYDLTPDRFGLFDIVYLGSILLHLRDPVAAIERVRSVLKPGGRVFSVDAISIELTMLFPSRPMAELDGNGRPWWWQPNLAGLRQMIVSTGLELEAAPRRVFLKFGAGQPTSWPSPKALLHREGRQAAVFHKFGDPHGVVIARNPD